MPFFISNGFQADTKFRLFLRRKPYPAFLFRNIFIFVSDIGDLIKRQFFVFITRKTGFRQAV